MPDTIRWSLGTLAVLAGLIVIGNAENAIHLLTAERREPSSRDLRALRSQCRTYARQAEPERSAAFGGEPPECSSSDPDSLRAEIARLEPVAAAARLERMRTETAYFSGSIPDPEPTPPTPPTPEEYAADRTLLDLRACLVVRRTDPCQCDGRARRWLRAVDQLPENEQAEIIALHDQTWLTVQMMRRGC